MESKKHKPSYIPYLLMFAVTLFILFWMEFFNWYSIIWITIIWLAFFYREEFYIHKIERERRKIIFELLGEKYNGGKETASGNYEVLYSGKPILFSFSCISTRGGISNNLKIFLEITNLDEQLKSLCKIHFYCEKLEDRDWIHAPFSFSWNDSIKSLSKNSEKRIADIKKKLDLYIEEKSNDTSSINQL